MPIDVRLMTLMQWLSPGFPVSSFAYSHGLETAILEGHVRDGASLQAWLDCLIVHGTGRTDAIWIRLGHRASGNADLECLNEEAATFQTSRERKLEAEKQGRAFVQTVNSVWQCDLPDLVLPLGVGAAARHQGIDIDLVVPLYLQSFLANLVAAAQRLMPLGQTEAQRLLSQLHPNTLTVSRASDRQTLQDVHSSTFMSDIMAMRHETLSSRLFQS